MHIHFDEKNPKYIEDFLKISDRLNLTALMHTPFPNRKIVSKAAKEYPRQIVPSGYVDLDASDVVGQVKELRDLGYRGLGELEFVKKPYNDPSYFPVYELANEYGWVVMFHTGIVFGRNSQSRKMWLPGECGRFTWRKSPGGGQKLQCSERIAEIPNTSGQRKSRDGIRMCSSI